MCGASLAHHGLLGPVEQMKLCDVDLSQVPTQHLDSLASHVTRHLQIENITGLDLVSFMKSLKCEKFCIVKMSLEGVGTQTLVQALESRIERLVLKDVILDHEALTEYSGQGLCGDIRLYDDTADRYRGDLQTWTRSIKWRFFECRGYHLYIRSEMKGSQ